MQTAFPYKARFGIVRMLVRTPRGLDLYLVVDQRQVKVIDAKYSVRVGYWASRNNVHEYKVYVTMIQMFDLNFVTTCDKLLETTCGQPNQQTATTRPIYYAKQNVYQGQTKQTNIHQFKHHARNGQKMKMIQMMTSMSCLFLNMMQTMMH